MISKQLEIIEQPTCFQTIFEIICRPTNNQRTWKKLWCESFLALLRTCRRNTSSARCSTCRSKSETYHQNVKITQNNKQQTKQTKNKQRKLKSNKSHKKHHIKHCTLTNVFCLPSDRRCRNTPQTNPIILYQYILTIISFFLFFWLFSVSHLSRLEAALFHPHLQHVTIQITSLSWCLVRSPNIVDCLFSSFFLTLRQTNTLQQRLHPLRTSLYFVQFLKPKTTAQNRSLTSSEPQQNTYGRWV